MSGDYDRYLAWLRANGVVFPRLHFPHTFDGLCGIQAQIAIPKYTAFVFVPYSLCITRRKALKSQLGEVIAEYEAKRKDSDEDDALYFYLISERLKGEDSFYALYFQSITVTEHILTDWGDEELRALGNPVLAAASRRRRVRRDCVWDRMKATLLANPESFPGDEQLLHDTFLWTHRLIASRSFAWKGGMLIPFADSLNHEEVSIGYLEFDPQLGKTQSEVDCSDFFSSGADPAAEEIREGQAGRHRNRLEKYEEAGGRVGAARSFADLDVLLQGLESSSDGDSAASFPESDCESDAESEKGADEQPVAKSPVTVEVFIPACTPDRCSSEHTELHTSECPVAADTDKLPMEITSTSADSSEPSVTDGKAGAVPAEDTSEPLNLNNYFALATYHSEFPLHSQVFSCYGCLNNSDLLSFYGFVLPNCYRDSLVFYVYNPVFSGKRGLVPREELERMTKDGHFNERHSLTTLKLKAQKICEGLFTYCRKPIVAKYKAEHPEADSLFSCSPTLAFIEAQVASDAIQLLNELKTDWFPATEDCNDGGNARITLANSFKRQQKAIVERQIALCGDLQSVLSVNWPGFDIETQVFSEGFDVGLLRKLYLFRNFLRSMRANKQMWLPTTLPPHPTPGYIFR